MSDEKIFIQPAQLLHDSFLLGARILASGFRPDYIVGIWRGGTPVGIAVQEFLDYAGVTTDHIAIRTSYYKGIEKTAEHVQVHGLGYLIDKICQEDGLLIVDDVFDSGYTITGVIEELSRKARCNAPEEIRVAVTYYKPSRNQTPRIPDNFVHETERWIKFSHSLEGLTLEEIAANRPHIHEIVCRAKLLLD